MEGRRQNLYNFFFFSVADNTRVGVLHDSADAAGIVRVVVFCLLHHSDDHHVVPLRADGTSHKENGVGLRQDPLLVGDLGRRRRKRKRKRPFLRSRRKRASAVKKGHSQDAR